MGWKSSNKTWTRMISVLTIVALLFTAMPVSLAASDGSAQLDSQRKIVLAEEESTEPTAEQTPTPDVPETPVPDPTPTPEGSIDPSVTPEESISPEPSLSPSPSPLPYGFAGMPEDFVLSDKQMREKEVMSKKDVVSDTGSQTPGEDYVDNQVMFWADSEEYAQSVAVAYNGELVKYFSHLALVELKSSSVMEALTVAADTTNNMPALDANHIIRLDPGEKKAASKADTDFIMRAGVPTKKSWFDRPNDPFLQSPDTLEYQWMHDVVNTYEAWGVTRGSSSIKVAVIDTGCVIDEGTSSSEVHAPAKTHEDLAGKVTVINMSDYTHKSNNDNDGHGTHVAGIIAATAGNGKGGAGIAPGVSILSLAAIPDGEGTDYNIAAAVSMAVINGADIINMSLGGYSYNGTLEECIASAAYANVTCIAAMGNDGSNSLMYPAAYDYVIAVAAVNSDMTRAYFSNYGSWADIAAPGVSINSCVGTSASAYENFNGTSMAAPVVSGVAALYLSKTGRITPSALEKKLESSVNKSSSSSIGAGVIDASKLFAADKAAPTITVKNTLGTAITNFKSPIPLESTMVIEQAKGSTNAKMILYTLDGSTPSVKNGDVVNGKIYSGEINLSECKAGVPITVKAICISGMGVTSSSASVKFTLSLSSSISEVTMSGVDRITAGGKTTYTASVLPISSVSQKVLWSIVTRGGAQKAVLSSTGVLTTVAKDGGDIVIRATSVINPDKYVEKSVAIVNIPFLKSIKLDSAQVATSYSEGETTTFSLAIASATNALNQPVEPDSILRKWSSSNTKVVTVDNDGLVTVVGSGSATIKCLALDGSGKSASCAVSVAQRVESIAVKGQASIASGKTATYKATVLPSNAKVKSVEWSLVGAPSGVTISKTSGVVSVAKTVTSGSFTVYAIAKDGSGIDGSTDVSIAPLSGSITITTTDTREAVVRNSAFAVTAATIFTVDTEGTPQTDDILQLGYSINGNSTTPVWSSSNSAIASVDQSGAVTGLKAGSATITCATQDGSGRKATMKVTVIVPVSYLTVGSKMPLMEYADPTIAFGKTAANTVAFGDTYGAPTIKKVKWDFVVLEYDSSDSTTDVTAYMKSMKRVSISSSGVLSVSSAMKSNWEDVVPNGYYIIVTATATDGSGVSDSLTYWPQPSTSTMVAKHRVEFFEPDNSEDYMLFFDGDSNYKDFTVTSSNPKVAGLMEGVFYGTDPDYPYCVPVYTGVPGTAIITIKANDGTNKYTTVTIYVDYWD